MLSYAKTAGILFTTTSTSDISAERDHAYLADRIDEVQSRTSWICNRTRGFVDMVLRIVLSKLLGDGGAPTRALFFAGVVALCWLLVVGGCLIDETQTIGLFDYIDESQPAGPWRWLFALRTTTKDMPEPRILRLPADELPRFQAGHSDLSRMRRRDEADSSRIDTDEHWLALYRVRTSLRKGEDVLLRLGIAERCTPEGTAHVRVLFGGDLMGGADATVCDHHPTISVAAESPYGEVMVEVSVVAPQGREPVFLESIMAAALADEATEHQRAKAQELLAWASHRLGDKTTAPPRVQAVIDRWVAPIWSDNMTLNTIMMAGGDTLLFALPPCGSDQPFSLWYNGIHFRPGGVATLKATGETQSGWIELGTWTLTARHLDTWSRVVVAPAQKGETLRAVRLVLTGEGVLTAIAEPVFLPSPRVKQSRMNFILIDLDTMRADRLGCYGYTARATSARLDSIFDEKGFYRFEHAFSPAPYTLPATKEIFASRYLEFPFATDRNRDYPMLADILRQNGYYCAAFTGGGVLRAAGFQEGFHEYHWSDELGKVEESFPPAMEWVHAWRGGPFFLFVHTYESHMPLIRDRFTRDLPHGRLGDLSKGESLLPRNMDICANLSRRESLYVQAAYDGGVWAATEAVAEFFTLLEEHGLWRNTVVVVLSDHGEEFWDHLDTFACHRHSLYGELLNVPFLLYTPSHARTGMKGIDTDVSTVDLLPTMLDLLSIPCDERMEGISLERLLDGGSVARTIPILATTAAPNPARRCIIDEGLKYIEAKPMGYRRGGSVASCQLYPSGGELYSLREDPLERDNLISKRPKLVELIRQKLHGALANTQSPSGSTQETISDYQSPSLRKQLIALGYLDGS